MLHSGPLGLLFNLGGVPNVSSFYPPPSRKTRTSGPLRAERLRGDVVRQVAARSLHEPPQAARTGCAEEPASGDGTKDPRDCDEASSLFEVAKPRRREENGLLITLKTVNIFVLEAYDTSWTAGDDRRSEIQ